MAIRFRNDPRISVDDRWHARLFGDPELPQVLAAMAAANRAAVDAALAGWAGAGTVDARQTTGRTA